MLSEEGQKTILSQSAEYPMRKGMQADPALKPFAELDPPKLTPADLVRPARPSASNATLA